MKIAKKNFSDLTLILTVLFTLLVVLVVPVHAITFTTGDSQFDAGVDNRGWWSDTIPNSDTNDNYFTGLGRRSFFTFDLSSLSDSATSATLKIIRATSGSGNELEETLELFHVSTDAAVLNNNTGTSMAIFDDLGSGVSYGAFNLPGQGLATDVLMFGLNAAALSDINSAAGGFFSIGGTLVSDDGTDFLFSGSLSGSPHFIGSAVLEIGTGPVNSSIPEPSSMLLFSTGLAGLIGLRWKNRMTRKAPNF